MLKRGEHVAVKIMLKEHLKDRGDAITRRDKYGIVDDDEEFNIFLEDADMTTVHESYQYLIKKYVENGEEVTNGMFIDPSKLNRRGSRRNSPSGLGQALDPSAGEKGETKRRNSFFAMIGTEEEEKNMDAEKILQETLDAPSETNFQRRGSKRFRDLTSKVSGLNIAATTEKKRNSNFVDIVKSAANSRRNSLENNADDNKKNGKEEASKSKKSKVGLSTIAGVSMALDKKTLGDGLEEGGRKSRRGSHVGTNGENVPLLGAPEAALKRRGSTRRSKRVKRRPSTCGDQGQDDEEEESGRMKGIKAGIGMALQRRPSTCLGDELEGGGGRRSRRGSGYVSSHEKEEIANSKTEDPDPEPENKKKTKKRVKKKGQKTDKEQTEINRRRLSFGGMIGQTIEKNSQKEDIEDLANSILGNEDENSEKSERSESKSKNKRLKKTQKVQINQE